MEMNEPTRVDAATTQSFDGLAAQYDAMRPGYPDALCQYIFTYAEKPSSTKDATLNVADIGCGSGISTRALVKALGDRGTVIGIEPGFDMLAKARKMGPPTITYLEGSAEELPVASESFDIVAAAQAIQWFARDKFYPEALRVLRPGGVIAIFENNRNWRVNSLLEQHEEFLETYSVDPVSQKRYSRFYRNFAYAEELAARFRDTETHSFSWQMRIPGPNFLAMAKTSTQVKRAEKYIGQEKSDQLIMDNVKRHVDSEGFVVLDYETNLYIARK